MKVGLADLPAQYESLKPEIDAAVQRVLASGNYILGDEVAQLEAEVAADHGMPHAIGVSSGTDALLAALWSLGIGPGDEVITTAFSFFATAGAIVRLGATPVFADIDPATFNLDPASVEAKRTSRTKAILPVHLFGRPCAISSTLPIVEDAAQAYGITVGNLATLSFFPTKNLGAAGDAGMVLTRDTELADEIRLYRSHGAKPKYVHHVVGANLRLDALQAAILRVKRPHVAAWTAKRRANAARYRELLAGTPLTLPTEAPGHVWHHFVVRAPRRDELRAFLSSREIESEIYYPRALHLQPCFGGDEGSLPHAEQATREVLALPIHAELTPDQLDFVADSIRAFHGT